MAEVLLHMSGYPDSDEQERADLTARLREELIAHDLEASHAPAVAPPGSKGAGLDWATLVVNVAGVVPAMVAALQGWLGRHHGAAVSLEIDGDKLTLEHASEADQRRLVETFLARHGAG